MGTRNLTIVIVNNETKVAQYGQWDGYPGGQGITALEFLRTADLQQFKNKLSNVKWLSDEEQDSFLSTIGVTDGWMNGEQAQKYHARFPFVNRDHGAKILSLINESEGDVFLNDGSPFAGDSLMCEWAYVIDFDKNTFEIYEGFNKTPLTDGDRFFTTKLDKDRGEYKQIKIVKSYSLSDLPTEEQFLKDLEPVEDEG